MNKEVKLKALIESVRDNKVILPDFQRDYVWDIESQKRLLSSILSGIPFGELMTVIDRPNIFSATHIGTKVQVETIPEENGNVEYLLDGQQRLTTLTNMFSNYLYRCDLGQLKAGKLKSRWFIALPKQSDCIFGSNNFNCDVLNENHYHSPFEYDKQIFEWQFTRRDHENNVFYPHYNFNSEEREQNFYNQCVNFSDEFYLVPLFLLSEPNNNNEHNPRLLSLLNHITNQMLDSRSVNGEISQTERDNASDWKTCFYQYICNKFESVMNVEYFDSTDLQKALDSFQYINLGGQKLSTFDLIVAKAYRECTERNQMSYRQYVEDLVSDDQRFTNIKNIAKVGEDFSSNSDFLNVFLNTLVWKSNEDNINNETDFLSLLKEQKRLDLSGAQIMDNTETCLETINKTIKFLNEKCGIREWGDLKYRYIYDIISLFFLVNEDPDEGMKNKLAAWYWYVIFSGQFTERQNEKYVKFVKSFIIGDFNNISQEVDTNKILNTDATSLSQLTYVNNGEQLNWDDIIIKHMRNYVCQYFLSKGYNDPFENTIRIDAGFVGELEDDHIIALSTATTYGQSSQELRNDKTHPLNSPLNAMLVTKTANNHMRGKSIADYWNNFNSGTKDVLLLSTVNQPTNNEEINQYLNSRFELVKNNVIARIQELLANN